MESGSPLWAIGAGELVAGYQARAFSPVELVADFAERIDRLSPVLGR